MNIDQVIAKARQLGGGATVGVTLVTNQPSRTVSYATGELLYYPAAFIGTIFRPERLSTSGGDPLKYYFSDRMHKIDPGSFPEPQPFDAAATDKLGMSISTVGNTVIRFTLQSWQDVTFSVAANSLGDLLVGVGPSIGNQPGQAAYIVSFAEPRIGHPPH